LAEWLVTNRGGLPARRLPPIAVLTSNFVDRGQRDITKPSRHLGNCKQETGSR